ncbi:MAG: aminotransferase class I/II-fold pyridoxal phosphate-dependent enzyme, partial [Verrucomicrobiae bacterium]|nr:aminotransferase class I/II-fold pyridoxal phosphate-dependent enzyme [Verrucomicrobiae bacterium]
MRQIEILEPLRQESTAASSDEVPDASSALRPPASRGLAPKPITLRLAEAREREEIFRLRHEVYAHELGQHAPQPEGRLCDALDNFNVYLVASLNGVVAGFISITPPEGGRYSVDKYLRREDFPQLIGRKVYEARLLTVTSAHRGREIACALMYAALRWVEAHGGERIVAIGRREILDLYLHVGLERLGRQFKSGAVTYELLAATVAQLRARLPDFDPLLHRLERSLDWRLNFPFRKPANCFHGGAFFDAIGPEFDHLDRRHTIINADVLDAWFPPSPHVMAALQEDLPWLLRTSPPTAGEGMVRTIARTRVVTPENILPAAGSSDAIFLAFRHWLKPASRVLILDPTYGEYAHVLEQVVRCRVDRLSLSRENNYRVDLGELAAQAQRGYDLIALVNPNSPTGQHVSRREMEELLRRIPKTTRVWVDETYVEYAGPDESLERFAAASRNVVVCKSMSKVYALSGVRAAYLCGPAPMIEELRGITPPWAVSLPAQVAAVAALQDANYYAARYTETHELRPLLTRGLAGFHGWEIVPGIANFLLCHLPEDGPTAAEFVSRCRAQGLYLRDVGVMGRNLGQHTLRIAVKDAATNARMLEIMACVQNGNRC